MKGNETTLQRALTIYQKYGISGLVQASIWRLSSPIITYDPDLYKPIHNIMRFTSPTKFTDAPPLQLLWADPNDIFSYVSPDAYYFPGQVLSGNWDRKREPFNNLSIYNSIQDRIKANKDWKDTQYYDQLLSKPNDAPWGREFNSREAVKNRLCEIDSLISTIQENGYHSQRELLKKYPNKTRSKNNDAKHPILNEINVNITRDGEIVWVKGGLHRLCISKVLGLEEIPLLVLARHRTWQTVRDIARQNPNYLSSEVLKHPDIVSIQNGSNGEST